MHEIDCILFEGINVPIIQKGKKPTILVLPSEMNTEGFSLNFDLKSNILRKNSNDKFASKKTVTIQTKESSQSVVRPSKQKRRSKTIGKPGSSPNTTTANSH